MNQTYERGPGEQIMIGNCVVMTLHVAGSETSATATIQITKAGEKSYVETLRVNESCVVLPRSGVTLKGVRGGHRALWFVRAPPEVAIVVPDVLSTLTSNNQPTGKAK